MKIWIHFEDGSEQSFLLEELPLDRISDNTPVWHEGLEDWIAASESPIVAAKLQERLNPETESAIVEVVELESSVEPVAPEAPSADTEPSTAPEPMPEPMPAIEPAPEPMPAEAPYDPAPQPEFQPYQNQPWQGYPAPQPMPMPMQGPAPKESDVAPISYLVWSIVLTMLCCSPISIAAIVTSVIARNKYSNGDYAGAKRMSNATAWLIMISIVLTLCTMPLMFFI